VQYFVLYLIDADEYVLLLFYKYVYNSRRLYKALLKYKHKQQQ